MITATFTDGRALVCEMPSQSKNGVYLVKVEPCGGKLMVRHACPADQFRQTCSHVDEAVSCFHTWHPSSIARPIVKEHETITLKPEWEQIPIPGNTTGTREYALAGERDAT